MYRILYIPSGCFVDMLDGHYSYHSGMESEDYNILEFTSLFGAQNCLNKIIKHYSHSFLIEGKANMWYTATVMSDEFEIVKVD